MLLTGSVWETDLDTALISMWAERLPFIMTAVCYLVGTLGLLLRVSDLSVRTGIPF